MGFWVWILLSLSPVWSSHTHRNHYYIHAVGCFPTYIHVSGMCCIIFQYSFTIPGIISVWMGSSTFFYILVGIFFPPTLILTLCGLLFSSVLVGRYCFFFCVRSHTHTHMHTQILKEKETERSRGGRERGRERQRCFADRITLSPPCQISDVMLNISSNSLQLPLYGYTSEYNLLQHCAATINGLTS